jgi:uncharacterized protein YceK
MVVDWTSIVLGVITLLGGCGWVIDRKKHKEEIESLKADIRQKDMNLSKDYVTEWRTYIAEPLQQEVKELRNEVNELRYALQKIGDCPHSSSCPVYDELQRQSRSDER